MRHALGVHVLAATAAFVSACAEPDKGRVVVESNDECGLLAECSIADSACQKAILAITACVREDELPPLPVIRTITRDEFRAELRALNATALVNADESTLASMKSAEKAFEALRLVTMDGSLDDAAVDSTSRSLAAFYRPTEKDVSVLADTTMNRVAAMNELAHEFTHYLQDRAGQLEAAFEPHLTLDQTIARRALIEGEALVTGSRALGQAMGLSAGELGWNRYFDSVESAITRSVDSSESPLLVAMNGLQYILNPRYIERTWEDRGRAGVDALLDEPARTQLDVHEGRTGTATSLAEKLACNPPLPPEGFDLAGVDSLGMLGVYALLGTQAGASLDFASLWRQDALALYRERDAAQSGEPSVLAVWRMRLQSELAAMSFASQIAPLGLLVTRTGRELSISVSSNAARAPIGGDALAACPTDAQLAAALPDLGSMNASLRRDTQRLRPFAH